MITATIAAMSISLMTGSLDTTPPARPSGSIGVGHGMELLDKSTGSNSAPKPDPSLPGGRRTTLRYVWWSVYVKPTGNVEMRTSLTCTHLCENPGNHNHGPPCKIGGCAAKCPYEGHQTTLTTTSTSSRSTAVSRAVQRAQSSVRSVTAKVGASSFGVSAEVSGTATEGSSSSVTLGSSISSAVGRSVSGSVPISLGHFNTKPCTAETWWFGTKEYEIRMIIQVFEQDYYAESWSIGGRHGVIPSSGLKLAGPARFVGASQDVQLGTYQVPSNVPVKKVSDLECSCKPRATITPNPHSDHSSLPSGTTKFYVTPKEEEKVFFTNPTNETLVVAYADIRVEVLPGEETEIDRNDLTGPIPIDVTKMNGERVMRPVYGASTGDGTVSHPDTWADSFSIYEAALTQTSNKGGNAETTWKIEEGEAMIPEIGDEVLASELPSVMPIIEVMISSGLPTRSIPAMNGRTPVLEIRGDIPDGATFSIESGESTTAADTFMKIKGIDGETKAVFVKFDGVDGESQNSATGVKLVCRKAGGDVFSEQPVSIQQAAIRLDMTPRTGPAGSSATLIIDTTEVIAFMAQNSDAHAKQFDLVLNFGGGGGASGPERVPMDPSGITRVPVTRGAVPGDFQVAVGVDYRKPTSKDSVKSEPGHGIVRGG